MEIDFFGIVETRNGDERRKKVLSEGLEEWLRTWLSTMYISKY